MLMTAGLLLLIPALLLRDLRNGFYVLHAGVVLGICWAYAVSSGWPLGGFYPQILPWIIGLHLVSINLVTFLMYGYDKRKAKYGGWRVSEAMLHMFALIGGTIGAVAGQKYFRHKTKKQSFKVLFWVFFVIQILAAVYLYAAFSQ